MGFSKTRWRAEDRPIYRNCSDGTSGVSVPVEFGFAPSSIVAATDSRLVWISAIEQYRRMKPIPFNALFVVVAAFVCALAAAAPAPPAPGTYRDWHDVDEVTIVQPFNASAYSQIAVESFDSAGVKMPDTNDNTYRAVQSALRVMKPAFMDGVALKAKRKVGPNAPGKTLVIRARLTKIDPGSQAARYFVGFGAGAVKIAIVGEIVDRASGKVFVRFAQERRSAFGAFGGGYAALFQRTARQLGGDVGELINAF